MCWSYLCNNAVLAIYRDTQGVLHNYLCFAIYLYLFTFLIYSIFIAYFTFQVFTLIWKLENYVQVAMVYVTYIFFGWIRIWLYYTCYMHMPILSFPIYDTYVCYCSKLLAYTCNYPCELPYLNNEGALLSQRRSPYTI